MGSAATDWTLRNSTPSFKDFQESVSERISKPQTIMTRTTIACLAALVSFLAIPCMAHSDKLVDSDAAAEVQALANRLKDLGPDHVLFGQTDANMMGIDPDGTGWFNTPGKSDIHTITGTHPAVYGYDLLNIGDDWEKDDYLANVTSSIQEAHARGGLITVSWHATNPITGESFNHGSPVPQLLPGAEHHHKLTAMLDIIAGRIGNLKNENGNAIPIIFRPWHEHNGGHFWWGESRCTIGEYVSLWRFTVEYLRDTKGVHNFLYAYSPVDWYHDFDNYMERYPGDDYVDILGLDSYINDNPDLLDRLSYYFREMAQYANRHGKLVALTEVGYKNNEQEKGMRFCKDSNWLSQSLIDTIKVDTLTRQVAYIVFWRNEAYNPSDYYLPYPGTANAPDLKKLSKDPFVMFEKDL